MNELTNTRRVDRGRRVAVIVACGEDGTGPAAGEGVPRTDRPAAHECLAAIRASASPDVAVLTVAADAASVNDAIAQLAPADVIVLLEPCLVGGEWIERLGAAAGADTNIASASALAETGTALTPPDCDAGEGRDFSERAAAIAARSDSLRPRLSRAVGPCIYIRRDALELVGPLDETLELDAALELDFAQRCVLSGLTHVAADDVLVAPCKPRAAAQQGSREPQARLRERYPYLEQTPLADSAVLSQALRVLSEPAARLAVTVDARALDGAITGTHVHVLELILALARTDELALRVLIRGERIDRAAREALASLTHTELLDVEALDSSTARTAVFHRPQQTFSPGDVALALSLGESFVVSQLDLIAYRNPGYFEDAATWQDYRAASRHGLSAAERVVVFSEHTREELLADRIVERARLAIVPPGLDHRASAAPERPAALAEGFEHAPFLLCLGTDFRHKNRIFALRLLAQLRRRHDWSGALVLAGTHISPGSSAELERSFIAAHPGLASEIVSLGAVGEREKSWLIEHARAVVYPSAYEGFGLVPFESALQGTPCVFAPQASLAEVAPEQTATIVPWDLAASAERTLALLNDADARRRHVETLAARARELTWDAAARAMVGVYREATAAPVRDSATLSRDLVKREARLSVQHEEEVARLLGEREHAKAMYDALNAEVGFGLSLIGPRGALPESVQRALLAVSARPTLSRPIFAVVSGVFVLMRALGRPIGALLGRSR